MLYRLGAEAVLLLHFGFIAFVLLGGLLAMRWRWIAWLHLPAAAWGFFVELSGRVCPLTDAENFLRLRAGQSGYAASFLEHWLLPVIYPASLTRGIQWLLASVVVGINAAVYVWLWRRSASRHS